MNDIWKEIVSASQEKMSFQLADIVAEGWLMIILSYCQMVWFMWKGIPEDRS